MSPNFFILYVVKHLSTCPLEIIYNKLIFAYLIRKIVITMKNSVYVPAVIAAYNYPISYKGTMKGLLLQSRLPFEDILINDVFSESFRFNHSLVRITRNYPGMKIRYFKNLEVKKAFSEGHNGAY